MIPTIGVENIMPGSETPSRVAILFDAADLVSGKRDAEYGSPSINLACAGELMAVYEKYVALSPGLSNPAHGAAMRQVLLKVARAATSPVFNRDTYVDGAGYFALAGEAMGPGRGL